MKTKLLGLAMVLCISQMGMAQFHIGAKAGTNITKLDGISFRDQFRYSYHVGGFMEIGLGGRFTLQPEVLFNQYTSTLDSSYKEIYENIIASDQSKVKLNYLAIPILLDYRLVGPLHLQAGPQFSVLIDKNKNFLQNGGDAFTKGDFAMLGGAQINLGALRISGRYIIGLNNINDIDNRDKWKSQAIQLSLGLAL